MGKREVRLKVASLTGLTARYLGGFGEQTCADAQLLRSDLEAGHDPKGRVAAVLAVLREVSTSPEVLTAAAAMYSPDGNGYFYGRSALKLLARAGADLDEAARVKAARGHGWVTPQADPATDMSAGGQR